MRRAPPLVATALVAVVACGHHEPLPAFRAVDARFGRLAGDGDGPSPQALCQSWGRVVDRDPWAASHVSFPEADPQAACFTAVEHDGRRVHVAAPPRGCAFPDATARARLDTLAGDLDALATDVTRPHPLFPCSLTAAERAAASRQNARALRAAARAEASYPYAAVLVPGEGSRGQEDTALVGWLPGSACRALGPRDLERLDGMPLRTARAADAIRGGVAPLVLATGGAVHSRLVEAFAMMHLLACREGIDEDRILVEPCAEHTHTNLRNSGRWLVAMGARAAYLVTDDGIQSDYFEDASGFDLILGSIDQRARRDWGTALGSWRRASKGMPSGFWFTPYRFWAEARDGLGSVSCVGAP